MTKPTYAPNAIATPRGWVDPKTGELLVAVRGLKVEQPKAVKPVEVPVEEPKEIELVINEVVDTPVEETEVTEEKVDAASRLTRKKK